MYANNFFKTENHDYQGFFSHYSVEETDEITSKLRKVNKELEELTQEFTIAQSKMYNADFTPTKNRYVISYCNRNYDHLMFDLITGAPYDENDENVVIIPISCKAGFVTAVVGYCFSLGAVIERKYRCSINSNNKKANTKLVKETIVPIFENDNTVSIIPSENSPFYSNDFELNQNASEFLKEFFGEDRDIQMTLDNVKRKFRFNKSFEILYRTCKNDRLFYKLIDKKVEQSMPVHKIIGCTQKEYEELEKNDVTIEFVELKDFFKGVEGTKYHNLNKTTNEWITYLIKCKEWREDLAFYHIPHEELHIFFVKNYIGVGYRSFNFSKYYPFGKFCSYVINETINQGFNNLGNFIELLRDYLRMCEDMDVNPTLYSSYLTITHDITARNHKIKLTEEQEAEFCKKYEDFEMYKGKDYMVIAPKNAFDVIQEGDTLNHCVASYIKRILDDESRIYFLRSVKDITQRLITVEVRNGAVCQARGMSNRNITSAERKALFEFAAERGLAFRVS